MLNPSGIERSELAQLDLVVSKTFRTAMILQSSDSPSVLYQNLVPVLTPSDHRLSELA